MSSFHGSIWSAGRGFLSCLQKGAKARRARRVNGSSLSAAERLEDRTLLSGSTPLSTGELNAIAEAAAEHWINSGISAEQLAALESVQYEIADLGIGHLGQADGNVITIDDDAAGTGSWFVDPTPATHEEFVGDSAHELKARPDSLAAGQYDLLSVLLHEQGHTLGLTHDQHGLMSATLSQGTRLLPEDGAAWGADVHSDLGPQNMVTAWEQLGDDIDGEAADDRSGYSVSLSADGNTIAIGAYANAGNGTDSGHVRIYTWNASTSNWEQQGEDIDGEAAGDQSGFSVSLSADGSTFAIGAPHNDGNGTSSGHVRVYTWNSSTSAWEQQGADIDGDSVIDQFGYSVSLSADGNTIAIGAPNDAGNGTNSGHVRVYAWNASSSIWEQLGSDIDGEAEGDLSGRSVSLSADGSTIAIGAIRNDGNGDESGHVRVYTWNASTATWDQQGVDIDGEAADDNSGTSVSLSADGNTLAIAAFLNDGNGTNSGHVRVYAWDSATSAWKQQGADIDGEAAHDWSGYSVSLSADGNTIAIGARHNSGNFTYSGHVRIYAWNASSSTWVQQGADIDGEAADDYSGRSVSLNADGSTVAIGASFNDGNGTESGHVRVYRSFSATHHADLTDGDLHISNIDTSIDAAYVLTTDATTVTVHDSLGGLFDNRTMIGTGSGTDTLNFDLVDLSGGLVFGDDLTLGAGANFQFNILDGAVTSSGTSIGAISVMGSVTIDASSMLSLNSVSGTNLLGQELTLIENDGTDAIVGEFAGLADGELITIDGYIFAINYAGGDGNDVTLTALTTPSAPTWEQLGEDIDGEAAGDQSGSSVSMSADGNTIAIGAIANAGNGTDGGHVRIYTWNSSTSAWEQKGADIDGEAADVIGFSVSLSADGNTIALGGHGNVDFSGYVRVYVWNASTSAWEQQGADIDGEAADDFSGDPVSLSADGNTIAIGATSNDGNGDSSGHVRVYAWNASTSIWEQQGADIDGEAAFDGSGFSVSLSADGNSVAIGANFNAGNGTDSGHVRIYAWNDSTSAWEQQGADIDGEAAGNFSGWSVSLSADGSTVAIGAPYNAGNGDSSGHVRVYAWNTSNSAWEQQGADIDGEAAGDSSGFSVSLSADGSTVAIGALFNDSGSGHVRVSRWNTSTSTWDQQGADIDGEAADDNSGGSVSLSADGNTVAIGAQFNDGNGTNSGHVRVYRSYMNPEDSVESPIAYDGTTGNFIIGQSDTTSFDFTSGPNWDPAAEWEMFSGDFNGDGLTDVAGYRTAGPDAGRWQLGLFNGTTFETANSIRWNASSAWRDFHVGDFNGDGNDDIAARRDNGQWWMVSGTGSGFGSSHLVSWSGTGWVDTVVGDFNADGKSDLAGLQENGQWWLAVSDGTKLQNAYAGSWGNQASAGWHSIVAGDFDGDNRTDVAARNATGRWRFGLSTAIETGALGAHRFTNVTGILWSNAVGEYETVHVGDFNNDGIDEIMGRNLAGEWWTQKLNGVIAMNQYWGRWGTTQDWTSTIGDFNADNRDDILGFDANTGNWHVYLSNGTKLQHSLFGTTPALTNPAFIKAGSLTSNPTED